MTQPTPSHEVPLFSPFTLKDVTLRNRIAVPPMCQYMAEGGLINDWHRVHYGALARGGSGLVIVEATAVSPEGRITPHCLGLWNDEQADAFKGVVSTIKAAGAVAGIQIAHAGRKASANIPWEGDDHMPETHPDSWEILGPSAKPFGKDLFRTPTEMTVDDIQRVQQDFVSAAKRALEAGFEWLELHFAHGYLAQSFFSKHANLRTDAYGGSYENRARFIQETFAAVRQVWPENLPLTIRLGVIEYDGRDEETLAESIRLVSELRAKGLDMLSVSIGFNTPEATIPWGPAFLEPVAARVRREANIPVSSAWGFGEPQLANNAVQAGHLDLVMVGRSHLDNPHWPYFAAKQLGQANPTSLFPSPYGHWLKRYNTR